MFKLVKSETRELTPEFVKEFREIEPSPTERDLNPARVQALKDRAEHHMLITFVWATVKFDGKVYRMNGNHSSMMLSKLDGAFPEGLKVHLDEYETDTLEGMALLFRQYDSRLSTRSPLDISGAYQGLYPELIHCNKAAAKKAIQGVVWERRHVEGLPVPKGEEAFSLFNEVGLYPFIKWASQLTAQKKAVELQNESVLAAMYATFLKSESGAEHFWDAVVSAGIQAEETDPITVLDRWLTGLPKMVKKPKPADIYQACIYAWNNHRKGKAIPSIKFDLSKGLLDVSE